jgi:Holliday junction resolvase RusA-like endonuclease
MLQKPLIDDDPFSDEPLPVPPLEWVEVFATTIPGEPQQRGSKSALVPMKGKKGEICPACRNPLRQPIRDKFGRVVVSMVDSNKDSPAYMTFARGWLGDKWGRGRRLIDWPIAAAFQFYFNRPQSHLGTGRNAGTVKASAIEWHASAPDLSKLIRCVEDCLTETVIHDDRLICGYLPPTGRFYTLEKARTELRLYVPARFVDDVKDTF